MAKRLISILLATLILLSALSLNVLGAGEVQYPIGGTVIAGTLNIRKSASTDSQILGTLTSGNTVTVLGEVQGHIVENETLWYKIQLSSGTGYVHSKYITLDEPAPEAPEASEDPEFEKLLDAQGFPESYRPMLRALHKKYPNWKFEALKTNLDWNTVVDAEYILGDSLIDKDWSAAWKSYDRGRYDFSKSQFLSFDGGSYHAASREYLMYCLDPRNFLTETNSLMFLVAYGQEGETAEGISKIISSLNWAKSYPTTRVLDVVEVKDDKDNLVQKIAVTESDIKEIVYIFEDGTHSVYTTKTVETVTENLLPTVSQAEISSQASSIAAEPKTTETKQVHILYDYKKNGAYEATELTGAFEPQKPVKEKIEIDSYAKAFYAAHKITGISAYMMAARIRQEQGTNGNLSGMGRVEGYKCYYNLWNRAVSGEDKFLKGAKHAKEMGWDTPLKSITGGSVWLDENYFQTGQDTLYLQKYDVVGGKNGYYWHEYMTYLPAPWKEAAILKLAFSEETIQNEAVFKIPIYNNMPSAAVPCPTANGTNNNYLQSITIGGREIPNFDIFKQSYTDIVISNPTETIDVNALPFDTGATVTGTGKLNLKFGVNNLGIEVKASNGSIRKYSISIVLNEGPADVVPEAPDPEPVVPAIGTTTLVIGDYITKIEPKTTVEEFIKALAVTNGTVKLQNSAGAEKKADESVATGDTVTIYDNDGKKYISYQTVIYGDVNGDGQVNSIDLLLAQRNIVGLNEITELQRVAADSNKDKNLNSVDLLITQRFIVGITNSIQGD